MSEELIIPSGDKKTVYEAILPQIESLISEESNMIANLSNISSVLHYAFNHLWSGFYLREENQLVLGPFHGPIACTRISKGKGVCGSVWASEKTIVVDNVNDFPSHISCSSESVSEIVIPFFHPNGSFIGVIDLDSKYEATFNNVDQFYLEQLSALITKSIHTK